MWRRESVVPEGPGQLANLGGASPREASRVGWASCAAASRATEDAPPVAGVRSGETPRPRLAPVLIPPGTPAKADRFRFLKGKRGEGGI